MLEPFFASLASLGNTMQPISIDDFQKVTLCTGTIVAARANEKANKPALVLEIDFGPEQGIKTSSAQITDLYAPDQLVGTQVVAVMNFPPLRIAGVKSEVLVLGAVTDAGVVLLRPDRQVDDGTSIA